ncbi:MAG: divalent-cation tolerance protein CutA [Candidatus Micrarchaeia archaeon]
MAKVWVLYSPFPSLKSAQKAGAVLINRNLAACVNIFPAHSIYEWEGKVQKQREWVLVAKTTKQCLRGAELCIRESHPYSVPAILSFSADANDGYAKWVRSQCKTLKY